MPESESHEVIVIGAGLGGLAAGLDLARGGADVTVLERHNLPGGFATSFVRGRFEFEPSLHEMGASPALKYLRDSNLGLKFLSVPEAYRLILTDKNVNFRAPFGVSDFTDAVIRSSGSDGKPVRDFMAACANAFEAFGYLNDNPRPSIRKLFREYGDFLRTGAAVPDEVADAVGLPESARDLIYPYWCYLGIPTDRVSFSIWASMIQSYILYGAVIPRGRSHSISTAMADGITSAGGKIRYNTEVKRILTRGRRISGVELTGGEVIHCRQVVSNVSPHHIFSRFMPAGTAPGKSVRLANARRMGMSFVVVYLGLDATMEELGLEDYSYFIAPHMNTPDLYAKLENRNDPEPMQASICLNAADPDASPPGTTILSITVGTCPEAWEDVSPADYHSEKTAFAERVIAQFERATGAPVSRHIEEIEIAAPPTFARYAASWNGTVYGYGPEPWDGIVPRVLTQGRERFYRNLHFCGGNAFRAYGYGSSILSGRAAAEKILKGAGR